VKLAVFLSIAATEHLLFLGKFGRLSNGHHRLVLADQTVGGSPSRIDENFACLVVQSEKLEVLDRLGRGLLGRWQPANSATEDPRQAVRAMILSAPA
jgi:hypothetical protein